MAHYLENTTLFSISIPSQILRLILMQCPISKVVFMELSYKNKKYLFIYLLKRLLHIFAKKAFTYIYILFTMHSLTADK